jgi:hypothetical protein
MDLPIEIVRGAPPDAQFVFLPIDLAGNPGELNLYVHGHFRLDDTALPSRYDLAPGFAIREAGSSMLIYIVTVDGGDVRANLIRNMAAALSELPIGSAASLWIPLMGTGAGRLASLDSLEAILEVLDSEPALQNGDVHITISTPPLLSATEFETLHLYLVHRGKRSIPSSRAGAAMKTILEFDADVDRLIRVAYSLSSLRRLPDDQLSTTLLLFSLSTANLHAAPSALSVSVPAVRFSMLLKQQAGDTFGYAWRAYFSRDLHSFHDLPQSDELLRGTFTPNAEQWMLDASNAAHRAGGNAITIADLIAAFWDLKVGRFDSVLRRMNVDRARLAEAFRRAGGKAAPGPNDAIRDVFKHLVHDQASHQDQLDFRRYAEAIRSFLTSPETHGPISISIQAPWGAGKSSLMKQVRHLLDEDANKAGNSGHAEIRDVLRFLDRKRPDVVKRPELGTGQRWTIWFNAWKYESSEQVWAGLVDAIISQVSQRLPPVDRELFLLRLNLARIDDGRVRAKIYDRIAAHWWVGARWVVLGGLVVIGAVAAGFGTHGAGLSLVGMAGLLGDRLWRSWRQVRSEPAKFSLAEYVRVPDYAKSVGIVHQIHRDLQRVIEHLPKDTSAGGPTATRPLVIFIDDLDRCSPNKVASIVEGINTFLASDQPEFLFIIGMDPQMVAAALEHAHKEVKLHLPSYEQTVPLGWRFMDKFIQLPFTIPPRSSVAIGRYVHSLTRPLQLGPYPSMRIPATGANAGRERPDVKLPVSPDDTQQARRPDADEAVLLQREVSKMVTNESEDVRTVMLGITNSMFFSPRDIKRILNFVRFVLLMRAGKVSARETVPDLLLYQGWIVLCMRWPDMARWLQWSGDLIAAVASVQLEGAVAQRLAVMENCALPQGQTADEWGKDVAKQLNLQTDNVSWLADRDLHGFFVQQAQRPAQERLSIGASVGFY